MTPRHPMLPWIVWFVSVLSYVVAVINRSSLSALGPVTQEHFKIDATTLSMFAVVQLLVYAILQIPVGVLLDRYGSTILIISGGILMLLGQVVMAVVPDVTFAILARVLVGAGDACTFISVMRMLPDWFPARQLPTLGQMTGLIGQTGQLISVTPLALLVGGAGWATGFMGIAATGFLVAVLCCVTLRDQPGALTIIERITGRAGTLSREGHQQGDQQTVEIVSAAALPPATAMLPAVTQEQSRFFLGAIWRDLRRVTTLPGVRLAYWLHFSAPFAANIFLLLWGTPFLIGGLGYDEATARLLLNVMIVAVMVSGVLLGPITSRFARNRVWIVFGIALSGAVMWCTLLLWPGTPPFWAVLLLVLVLGVGGPASMVAFEVARAHSPRSFAGLTTGFVNTGGFTATLIALPFIGLLLDAQGAGSPALYTLAAFNVSFIVLVPVWLLGLTMIVVEWRKTKRWMLLHGR